MNLKRLLLALLTVALTVLVAMPEAEARRRGRRGRRGRHSRRSHRTRDGKLSGSDFFGKRTEVRNMKIDESPRPGPRQYVFSGEYLQSLRKAMDEALKK